MRQRAEAALLLPPDAVVPAAVGLELLANVGEDGERVADDRGKQQRRRLSARNVSIRTAAVSAAEGGRSDGGSALGIAGDVGETVAHRM